MDCKVNNMFDVQGKHAIVTGASRGIGKALAKGLLVNGCKVVLVASGTEKLQKTYEEFKAEGLDVEVVAGDLSDEQDTIRVFNDCMEKLGGKLDILVPCAGINPVRENPENYPIEAFRRVINVNLMHVFIMSQMAAQVMLKQETRGKIVMIGSLGSHKAGHGICAYSASKGAVLMLCKSFACDLAGRNINVNVLAPGWIKTDIWADIPDERKQQINDGIPQGHVGEADDLVGGLLFLSSSASDYLNGSEIIVDGALISKL